MTVTELKPRIRPTWRCEAILGREAPTWIWECRAQRWADREGWVYIEAYGKRGHGYTPAEAFKEWKAQQRAQSDSGSALSAAQSVE